MPCRTVLLPGGILARVHYRGRPGAPCSVCGTRPHELLCDGKDPGSKTTCDAQLCRRCALHAPKDKDYCPAHAHQARLQRQFQFQPGGGAPP